jgi:hypothetical protein
MGGGRGGAVLLARTERNRETAGSSTGPDGISWYWLVTMADTAMATHWPAVGQGVVPQSEQGSGIRQVLPEATPGGVGCCAGIRISAQCLLVAAARGLPETVGEPATRKPSHTRLLLRQSTPKFSAA